MSPGASLVATQGTTIIVRDCFTPGGSISVTAPTSGNYAGLAIYSVNGDINMNSGAQFDVNGVIYAPSNNIVQSGSSWTQSACTELVAKNIQFNNGTGSLPRTGCSNYNYPTPSLSSGTTGVSLRE